MRLTLPLLVVVALLVAVAARTTTHVAPGSTISSASIRSHLEFLASDALNGRGSGTRDEWIAAVYLASQMRRAGIEPMGDAGDYVQKVTIERAETLAPPVMSFEGGRFTHGKEITVVRSIGAARLSGPLQKYAPDAPVQAGAMLLMPDMDTAAAMTAAGRAAAILLPASHDSRWRRSSSRLPTVSPRLSGVAAAPSRPTLVLVDASASTKLSALPEGSTVTLETSVGPAEPSYTWNAVGRLTGTDPARAAEVVLLSAHLDHEGNQPARAGGSDTIFNGADDDASGTVAVLELAHALAEGSRPKRTVVFAFFGSEEAGGYGSRFFADRPVVPLERIVANLQFEMLGRPDSAVPRHTLWLTGFERSNLGRALSKQGARLVQDPHPDQNFFQRSDNYQFARRGVVAHTVSSFGLHEEYHQPSDEIRYIDIEHMTDAIRSMLEPVRWLANSGFVPEWLPGMKP